MARDCITARRARGSARGARRGWRSIAPMSATFDDRWSGLWVCDDGRAVRVDRAAEALRLSVTDARGASLAELVGAFVAPDPARALDPDSLPALRLARLRAGGPLQRRALRAALPHAPHRVPDDGAYVLRRRALRPRQLRALRPLDHLALQRLSSPPAHGPSPPG